MRKNGEERKSEKEMGCPEERNWWRKGTDLLRKRLRMHAVLLFIQQTTEHGATTK